MTGTVTTLPIGEITEIVHLDGREIGDVFGHAGKPYSASPIGTRSSYRFADRDAAIAACVSYATRGYWTGEISSY